MRTTTLIFPADDSAPPEGFYEVVLKRGCRPRALGIIHNLGWSVYIDGKSYGESEDWKEAFGKLYQLVFLQGKKLTMTEYKNLVQSCAEDVRAGISIDKPINHLKSEIKI